MTCPTPARVYVSDCALQVGAEDYGLTPDEMREEAAHQWATGRGLADMAGPLARYLHYCATQHESVPKVSARRVWWFRLRDDGQPVVVKVERIGRRLWEEHLRLVALAGEVP